MTVADSAIPPTVQVFVYYPMIPGGEHAATQWGTPVIVDADGNPLPAPPPFTTQTDPATGKPQLILVDPDDGTILHSEETHQPTGLPEYQSPVSPVPLGTPEGEEDEPPPDEVLDTGTTEVASATDAPSAAATAPETIEKVEPASVAELTEAIEATEPAETTARFPISSGIGLTAEELKTLASPDAEPMEVAMGRAGAEEVGWSPLPLPEPAEPADITSRDLAATPLPIPEPAEPADITSRDLAATPLPIPEPAEPAEVQTTNLIIPTEETTVLPSPTFAPIETETRLGDVTGMVTEEVEDLPAARPETFEGEDGGI